VDNSVPNLAQKFLKVLKFQHFQAGTKFAYIFLKGLKKAKKG